MSKPTDAPIPTGIELHRRSKTLELNYADGTRFALSCEYLRVYSPSAEVKGHGPGQEVLQTGKMHVAITGVKPVGNYALQLSFDDGHDTGIFSWSYLWELGQNQAEYWQNYLDRMTAARAHRDPDVQVVRIGL
jgi:DUF971 family protein